MSTTPTVSKILPDVPPPVYRLPPQAGSNRGVKRVLHNPNPDGSSAEYRTHKAAFSSSRTGVSALCPASPPDPRAASCKDARDLTHGASSSYFRGTGLLPLDGFSLLPPLDSRAARADELTAASCTGAPDLGAGSPLSYVGRQSPLGKDEDLLLFGALSNTDLLPVAAPATSSPSARPSIPVTKDVRPVATTALPAQAPQPQPTRADARDTPPFLGDNESSLSLNAFCRPLRPPSAPPITALGLLEKDRRHGEEDRDLAAMMTRVGFAAKGSLFR